MARCAASLIHPEGREFVAGRIQKYEHLVQVMEAAAREDLLWDDEVRGLCLRVHADSAKSFIFVYRIGDRQRFIRIGKSPLWSLEAARARARKLRSIIDQGRDPARENRAREIPPVENLIQYIAENLVTKS